MDAAPTRFQLLTRERQLVRRRNRILLGALTAIISLATIFILLEISYRQEEAAAREPTVEITGSLNASPLSLPIRIELEPPKSQWPPLTPPIALLAPPIPAAVVQGSTTGSTEPPTQSVVASRERVPLPPPRPKRAAAATALR
jgi:hypothetical protein